jgi:hypothetical protein
LEVYMRKLRSLVVAVVFLAGCAVGGASSRFVVPPATAQQQVKAALPPPGASRWEQMCVIPEGDVRDATQVALGYGDSYWELVSGELVPSGRVLLCFRRPKA